MPKQGTSKRTRTRPAKKPCERNETQSRLGRKQTFYVPKEVSRISAKPSKTARGSKKIGTRSLKNTKKRTAIWAKLCRKRAKTNCPKDWEKSLPKFDNVEAKATRAYSGEVINAIADAVPQLIGGSADLAPSNNTTIKDSPIFKPDNTKTATFISASANTRWARR
jgi:transketolase